MADPKVNIKVEVDGSQAAASLDQMKKGLADLAQVGKAPLEQLKGDLKEVAAEAKSAATGVDKLQGAGTAAKEVRKVAEAVRETKAASSQGAEAGPFDRLKNSLLDIGRAIPGVSAGMGMLASGAAAAAGVFAGLAKAVSEYATAQEGVSKLAAALGQTGQLTKENVEGFQDLAAELQNTTAIATGEWIGVLTKLVQFGAKPESIGMHAESVKNLAGIVGDLGTATTMYAKALQGNYDAFARYGILVEEAATQTEKLDQLQRQLAERGSGQLEASAASLTGQFRALKLATSDVFEAIGRGVSKTGLLQWVLTGLTAVAASVAESLGGPTEAVAGLTNRVRESVQANNSYIETLKQIATASERIKQVTDAEIASIRERQRALDEISDAQMALDLANVDEAVAGGRMSPRDGIKARSKIRRDYAKQKFDREQEADLLEQSRLEQDFADQSNLLEVVRRRRKEAEKIPKSGPLTRTRSDSEDLIAALEVEKQEQGWNQNSWYWLTPLLGPLAQWRGRVEQRGSEGRIKEIDQQIEEIRRLGAKGPSNIASRTEEAARLREEESVLEGRVAASRDRVRGSGIPQRVAVRGVRYGINERREEVVERTELAGAAGQSIEAGGKAMAASTQRTGELLIRMAEMLDRVVKDTDQRISRTEAAAKNAANR